MSTVSRVVHDPAGLLATEIAYVQDEMRVLRERAQAEGRKPNRSDRWKHLSARLDGLSYAQAVYRDSCLPMGRCPHYVAGGES